MTIQRDDATQAALSRLLEEHHLDGDARLYREAMRESLIPTGQAGVYSLAANPKPGESVIDSVVTAAATFPAAMLRSE